MAETIPAFSTGLYYAKISMIEANACKLFTLWHNRISHPGSNMMQNGHTLKERKSYPIESHKGNSLGHNYSMSMRGQCGQIRGTCPYYKRLGRILL